MVLFSGTGHITLVFRLSKLLMAFALTMSQWERET